MPRSWIGWIILIVIGITLWKHPANVGHDVNHAITSITTAISSAFGG